MSFEINKHGLRNQVASPVVMPVSAAVFTALLCALFGSNVMAIKVSLTGLGAFTTAELRFALATVAVSVWEDEVPRSV